MWLRLRWLGRRLGLRMVVGGGLRLLLGSLLRATMCRGLGHRRGAIAVGDGVSEISPNLRIVMGLLSQEFEGNW